MEKTGINGSAAIFDFDGTLVDSFAHRNAIHKRISAFLLHQMKRRSDKKSLSRMADIISRIDIEMHQNRVYDRNIWWTKALRRYAGKDSEVPETAINEASALYWDQIKKKTTVFPGVRTMLHALKREDVKLGLISDGDGLKGMKMERIDSSGLAKLFDVIIVAGEDTPQVKPDPEAFLLIIDKLDVVSRNCVSVGDNPATDVDGALRAGMKVIIIRNKLAAQTSSSQRYYLVERRRLTKSIIDMLRQSEVNRFP